MLHHDQLPVDLIDQLVEHYTGVTEVKFQILLRYEFLSLQLEPSQICCIDELVSQTWLSFEGDLTSITHKSENTTTVSTGVVERCVYEWLLILSEKSSN